MGTIIMGDKDKQGLADNPTQQPASSQQPTRLNYSRSISSIVAISSKTRNPTTRIPNSSSPSAVHLLHRHKNLDGDISGIKRGIMNPLKISEKKILKNSLEKF